jgi:YD repeat-containing protein
LANGQYDLVLAATDINGNQATDKVTILVFGDLKVGIFTVSFLDLDIDADGIPVRVSRTYDSRKRGQSLDFGYGWTVDYQNVPVQKSAIIGVGWEVYKKGLVTFCIRPAGKRTVSITLPDGKVERFDAVASPDCAVGAVPTDVTINYIARPGTTSTLETPGSGGLLAQGGTLYDGGTGEPFNPVRYVVKTLEGFTYQLRDLGNGASRIDAITDLAGNTLTYTANGIVHSNGQSITFTRDALGRISQINDPRGGKLSYGYGAAGDLLTVTDRVNQQTTMTYNREHGLLTYTDPRGIQLLRNEFDASGKLIAQYDAQGNKLDVGTRDIPGKKQTVKDRRGNTTVYEYDDQGNVTTVTDALGGITRYTYDARGNELTKTDPNGLTSTRVARLTPVAH